MSTQKHTIRQLPKGVNFIDYCREAFPLLGSKTAVKKAVADQRLLLNGRPARFSDRLKQGDRLELKGAGLPKARKFDKQLPIVFQDDHLIVINKPAGIAVNGNRVQTVENALAGLPKSPEADALPRPVAVHRIDLPTKGLVLLAKTKQALMTLSQAFENNEVNKAYQAVVHGQPPKQLTIDQPIQGKDATTEVATLRTVPSHVFGQLSLVRLKPITGRTHQLRIHLQERGHLIVGDKAYAKGQKTILGKGLFLCACELAFKHPITGEPVALEIKPPKRFVKTLDREEARS
jgi:RluA family pseudouridine synthase